MKVTSAASPSALPKPDEELSSPSLLPNPNEEVSSPSILPQPSQEVASPSILPGPDEALSERAPGPSTSTSTSRNMSAAALAARSAGFSGTAHAHPHKPTLGVSLVVVDVQYDFLPPSGSLAVTDGDSIIEGILELMSLSSDSGSAGLPPSAFTGPWASVVATQDYHPRNHISFAANHPGSEPYTQILVDSPLPGSASGNGSQITQELWPVHCVQGTHGCHIQSRIKKGLRSLRDEGENVVVIQKGDDPAVDGYSALADNAYTRFTPLIRYLSSDKPLPSAARIAAEKRPGAKPNSPSTDIAVVVGLATDYCVFNTALDLIKFNITPYIPLDCTRGVAENTTASALTELREAGAKIFDTREETLVALGKHLARVDEAQKTWWEEFEQGQESAWDEI